MANALAGRGKGLTEGMIVMTGSVLSTKFLKPGDTAIVSVEGLGTVEQMDLRELYGIYREDGWGAAAYDPGMMVGVLLYGYCQRVRSSRKPVEGRGT